MFPTRRPSPIPETSLPNYNNNYNNNNTGNHHFNSLRRRNDDRSNSGGADDNTNNNNNDDANNCRFTTTTKQPTATRVQNLYFPKIYTYKCYGKYKTTSSQFTTTKHNHHRNTGSMNGATGGQCQGFAKRMEVLYNSNETVQMSRIEALQRFTSMNSDVSLDDYNQNQNSIDDDEDDHHGNTSRNNNNNNHNNRSELNEQVVFLSPALIYKYHKDDDDDDDDDTVVHEKNNESRVNNNNKTAESRENNNKKTAVDNIRNTGSPDSTTETEQVNNSRTDTTTSKRNTNNSPVATVAAGAAALSNITWYDESLLEEEVILQQDWVCYGATEVEYLSLENVRTGEATLVAVAPRNTGWSIRHIETEDQLRTITRGSFGWIDILHDNNSMVGYEDDDDDDDDAATSREKNKNNGDIVIDLSPSSIFTGLRIPNIDVPAIVTMGQEQLNRTMELTKLVSTHMQYNMEWLYNNVRDDFPNRTYEAGKRCLYQIPKTVDGTVTNMTKIIQFLLRSGGGDDDSDDDRPSGGRRF